MSREWDPRNSVGGLRSVRAETPEEGLLIPEQVGGSFRGFPTAHLARAQDIWPQVYYATGSKGTPPSSQVSRERHQVWEQPAAWVWRLSQDTWALKPQGG